MDFAWLFSAATTLSSIATRRSQAAKSLVDHKAALNAHDRARMRLANRAGSQLDPSMARLARYHNKMYEHHKAAIADIESQTFAAKQLRLKASPSKARVRRKIKKSPVKPPSTTSIRRFAEELHQHVLGGKAGPKTPKHRTTEPTTEFFMPGPQSRIRARGAGTASAMGAGETYLGIGHGLRHTSQAHYAGDPRKTKKNPHLWWLDAGGHVQLHEDTAANDMTVGRNKQTHMDLGADDASARGRIDHDLKKISVVHVPTGSPMTDKHEMRRVIDHMAQHFPGYELRGFTESAKRHIREHSEDVNYAARMKTALFTANLPSYWR